MRRSAKPLPAEGLAPRVLEVPGGAISGARHTPVGVLAHAGRVFVVSPDTGRDWPASLRKAGDCALASGDDRTGYRAGEVRGDLAVDTVAAYLRAAVGMPWVPRAFGLAPDSSTQEVRQRLGRMAVFELHRNEGEVPGPSPRGPTSS